MGTRKIKRCVKLAADYIKNNSQGNAALVAYYTNNLEDYRFSHKTGLFIRKSDSGKVRFVKT